VVVLACSVALGLAACGGDDDSDQVSSNQAAEVKAIAAVGEQLQLAYKQKDAKKLCSLVDPVALKKRFGKTNGCVKQLNGAFQKATAASTDFDLENVTVEGNRAVAQTSRGEGYDVHFKKVDGKWYIDLNPPNSGATSSSDSSSDE
jgi:predicted lipid-binding transport protein (Tim44 family)